MVESGRNVSAETEIIKYDPRGLGAETIAGVSKRVVVSKHGREGRGDEGGMSAMTILDVRAQSRPCRRPGARGRGWIVRR